MKYKHHVHMIIASICICILILATTFALWTLKYEIAGEIDFVRGVEFVEEESTQ